MISPLRAATKVLRGSGSRRLSKINAGQARSHASLPPPPPDAAPFWTTGRAVFLATLTGATMYTVGQLNNGSTVRNAGATAVWRAAQGGKPVYASTDDMKKVGGLRLGAGRLLD